MSTHLEAGIRLTPTEARLLAALRSRQGKAVSRAELTALAMPDAIVLERTIDVHVRALRIKLGSAAQSIETVRGIGYRYVAPET